MSGEQDSGGDEALDPFGGPDLTAALGRWAAEAQVDEAARARAKARWLQQQAAEETTFSSALVDLAERRRPVLVHTAAGRRHRGSIRAVGVDFIAVHTDTGSDLLIASDSITSVRTQPRDQAALSGRPVALQLYLADALAAMGEDRPRVTIATVPDGAVNGNLISVGRDVLTVRVDGDSRANVYVPLHAVSEIAIAIS